jgi:RNA polymerase subunit RPABC4/transcription elongation factor Spt4
MNNYYKSTFRSEMAIIPKVARWIAVLAFALLQFGLLVLVRLYVAAKDRPPDWGLCLISVVGGLFLVLIVLLIGYVNADSKRRGMNSLLWTLLVIFIPKALGFLAYFLLRKPLVIGCPKCGNAIGSDFRFCPKCGYATTPTCAHCGRPISSDYVCCPYCGRPVVAAAPGAGAPTIAPA